MQDAYQALADPTRRCIVKYLRGGERTAGEMAEYVSMSRTALVHHLTVLKIADLVRVQRRGRFQASVCVVSSRLSARGRRQVGLTARRVWA